jgi:hypothetical protein
MRVAVQKLGRPGAVLIVSALAGAVAMAWGQNRIEQLNPYTHEALIPASANTGSIRFEGIKAVKVFTKAEVKENTEYCAEAANREPGGSMFCPEVKQEAPAPAYRVTYSYVGEPSVSDEHGGGWYTFEVYFRGDELPAALRGAVDARRIQGEEAASYFSVRLGERRGDYVPVSVEAAGAGTPMPGE